MPPRQAPFLTIAEAERLAQRKLPRPVWLAIKAGVEQGLTLDDNLRAFTELGFSPTLFDRPESIDTTTAVLGIPLSTPIIVAPVAAQGVHPEGELASAAGAARHGTALGLSSWAAAPLERVLRVNPNVLFQLYWVGEQEQIAARVRDARAQGARALIVTLDWSHAPRRDWGVPPAPPLRMDARALRSFGPAALARPAWLWSYLRRGRIPELTVPNLWGQNRADIPSFGAAWQVFQRTRAPSWEDIRWIREVWGGPFMVKGINTLRDAQLAVDLGADAISVSNHGGNNIDGSPSPLRSLPDIVAAVGDQVEVLVDGGIRRGSDVVKALALGARAVFAGRATVYGLAVAGEAGVAAALEILTSGVRETLFGIGRSSLQELTRDDLLVLNRDFFVPPAR